MSKFCISALVDIIIEWLDNMHGVTVKILSKSCCKVPLLFSDFTKTWIISRHFRKILKHQLSWKYVPLEPSCVMRANGWADRREEANCSFSQLYECVRRVQPTRCNVSQFIYFCTTLYMYQTGFPSIIRSSKLHTHRQVLVWQIPDAVCAVLSSWWWTENPSETCKASYRKK